MSTARGIPEVHAYTTQGRRLSRVYVWQIPVRLVHWVLFLAIIALSLTGWYIHQPYFISRGFSAYVMGTMRFVHILAGYIFLAAVMVRLYWFIAGNYWASWKFFIPVNRKQFQALKEMIKYYTFFRREPVHQVGHNALAGFAYACIFLVMLAEGFTGLVLYSQTRGPGLARTLFGWATQIMDIQYLRLIHFLGMFAFIAFFIHHVYSAILVSVEERNGLVESIFSGFKFVPEWELREEELRREVLLHKSLPSHLAKRWVEWKWKKERK